MVAAATGAPTRPPANIEDFLWNIHQVLAAQTGLLPIDQLKDAYSKHLGHKCCIERFLVVGEGGLSATLKRIPHIVSLSTDNGGTFVKATQVSDTTKQQLIEADAAYRRELIKKNAAAKAKAVVGGKAPAAAAPKAAAAPAGGDQPAAAKAATPAAGDAAKRPIEGQAAGDAKKARTDSNDADTLARMLVQGVVRVLQNRQKAGKGALPVSELEEEFKALWKVPFNLQQAGETDAVTFLQKWPNKVELLVEGGVQVVQVSKKGDGKAKGAAPAKVSPPAGPPAAAKTPAPAAEAAPAAAKNGPTIPKRAGGPTRPPATIEDFLWNIHSVVDAYGAPMPLDQMKDAYSQHLGHKCAVERFLVVGEGGLAATLKRIPHIVSVAPGKDGVHMLKPTLPAGTTKESLIAADHQYRKQLKQKNQAAKEVAAKAGTPVSPASPPPASPPPDGAAATPAAPAAPAIAVKAAAPAAGAPAATAAQKRPAEGAAGESDAKKSKSEDADTLARMLVQGIVRVLQNRQKEGKGPLPIAALEEEFKALWKVPFNLQQAGETDTVTFLQKWPNKVDVSGEGPQAVVQLAKKATEKAKASGAPSATKASAPAAPTTAAPAAAKTGAGAPPAKSPAASPPPKAVAPTEAAPATSTATPATPAPTASGGDTATATIAVEEIQRALPEIREQAVSMLQAMQDMVRRQEALVSALQRLGVDAPGA